MNTTGAWMRSMTAVGCAGMAGDMACQVLEGGSEGGIDTKRTAEFVAVAALLMGPANHAFELLAERRFPGTDVGQIVRKV
eukprot:CAMPEP_0197415060 /NCGR_PEP_ID=MMETSP1170-20131217/1652_1 /TAXON_ID=54406 /ORGANISM="Sarcinochrysis sp, Strain CCMP770" /LENGTH=79 /DNA_ID=CAMNT_0042941821 /DNA_START=41 /DNA_END=276 /DNA_ORIENTATION=-